MVVGVIYRLVAAVQTSNGRYIGIALLFRYAITKSKSLLTDFFCVCPCFKRKTTWAINTKLGRHTLYRRILACIDPEVKTLEVKITGLWNVLPAWVCTSIRLL